MSTLFLGINEGPAQARLTLLTSQGDLGVSAIDTSTISAGRTLPALDGNNLIAWDFQVLNTGLPPVLGTINQRYASTGSSPGPASELSGGFSNSGGGGAACLGPGGPGLVYANCFFEGGSTIGGASTSVAPPTAPPDNTSATLEAYVNVTSLATSTQGVILTKGFGPTWVAPFNGAEMNLQVGNAGAIEFGMVDSAAPGVEIGVTVGGRDALTVGYHHIAVVIDQALKRTFLYVDGYQRGFFTFTGGVLWGTGPWMLGGNTLNTSDSSNVTFSRATISNVARSAAYIRSAAAGFIRS